MIELSLRCDQQLTHGNCVFAHHLESRFHTLFLVVRKAQFVGEFQNMGRGRDIH